MGTSHYFSDFIPIKQKDEQFVFSMMIKQQGRAPSVYFEVCKKDERLKLYCKHEISFEECIEIAKKHLPKEATIKDIITNENIRVEVDHSSVIDELFLDEEECVILNRFLKKGFLPLNEKVYMGLDGHDYVVRLEENGKEYVFSTRVPLKWANIVPVIKMLVNKIGLDEYSYYVDIPNEETISELYKRLIKIRDDFDFILGIFVNIGSIENCKKMIELLDREEVTAREAVMISVVMGEEARIQDSFTPVKDELKNTEENETVALEVADKYAEENSERYTHDEMFSKLRMTINDE